MLGAVTTGSTVVDVLVAVAAALTALSVIWAKALHPMVKLATLFNDIAPVIIDIGVEFRGAEGKSTLRGILHDTNSRLTALSAWSEIIEKEVAELLEVKLANGRTLTIIEREVTELMHEVKTANGRTLAQLADMAETRRIDLLPEHERTAADDYHLLEAPDDPSVP